MMALSPITPTADSGMDCHMKQELAMPAGLALDSPTGFMMTLDGSTPRFPSDASFIREDDAGDPDDQKNKKKEMLYIFSQRFDDNTTISYSSTRKLDEDSVKSTPRVIKRDRADNTDPLLTKPLRPPPHVCIYMTSNTAIDMEVDDGVNVTVNDMLHSILLDENIGLPHSCAAVFSLWISSPLVELQLRPQHKPFEMKARWREIVKRFSTASAERRQRDEPFLTFQRNVFFSRRDEEAITDDQVLTLLYEEAKHNILEGRYPCETENYISLAGIQARIELGQYNSQIHTIQFFKERLHLFLPAHVRRSTWSWMPILSKKHCIEVKIMEQYKRISANTSTKKLVQKYLEFCRTLPFYGAAFFRGQVEQPIRGLLSLLTHQDLEVRIAINEQGIYVIDQSQCTLLLGLKYEDMSWDLGKPTQEDNPDCLPCLFVQFRVLENGTRVSKILQIFSKQAVIMDSLIAVFVETSTSKEQTRAPSYDTTTDTDDTHMPLANQRQHSGLSSLANKLCKLTLATFDDEGHCIGQMGSWSLGY